jgi:uncharacterized protein (TIGR02246 family)
VTVAIDTAAAVRLLLDEREIRGLISAFGAALDRKDWTAYAETFAPDGEFEIMGQRRVGREQIAAGPARDLAKFARLQHFVANQVVDLHGDEASGQWYLFAVHVPDGEHPERHADIGGRYRFRCRRMPDGWRFGEVRLEVLWSGGLGFAVEDDREARA